LVHLRLGAYGDSISDFDASLKLQPNNAWSLYGRGQAESKLKKPADSEADLAAAKALNPSIADKFARYGLAQ
jgi:tetratricopeptide (TPR) repeat protein